MNAIYRLDRAQRILFDASGRRFDPRLRSWSDSPTPASGDPVGSIAAAGWLQRESRAPVRVPIGVIGPREATGAQLLVAEEVGSGLAAMGFCVICGGRQGVMEAVCKGVAEAGGMAIGMLPEPDPSYANAYAGIVIATGIGEARNALIARSALCLVAIGDSYGTLSEVALGRQFGKRVIGLEGAARVEGVVHVASAAEALEEVARCALGS